MTITELIALVKSTPQRIKANYRVASFATKRTYVATVSSIIAGLCAILLAHFSIEVPGFTPLIKFDNAQLPDRVQAFTLVLGFFFTLLTYRAFSYEREDVAHEERKAEMITRPSQHWKWIGWWVSSAIMGVVIRIGVAFVVIFLLNFFWALVTWQPEVVRSATAAAHNLFPLFPVQPKLLQVWVLGLYGFVFGFALVYMLVGIDDNEHAIGHIVYATGSFGLMAIVAINQIKIASLHLGITNLLSYVSAAQTKLILLLGDRPPDWRLPSIIPPSINLLILFKELKLGFPPSISWYGTIRETGTLFTLLVLVLGIFTLALARDAINDWWWLEATNKEAKSRMCLCGLWTVRILITLLLFFMLLVAVFPTVGDEAPMPKANFLHMVGGYGCGGVLVALIIVGTLVIPDPYGRNFFQFWKANTPRDRSNAPLGFRTVAFVLLSWVLLLSSVILGGYLVYQNPHDSWVLYVEAIVFPAGGFWMYLFNWYSKQHIRGLPKQMFTHS
jgi:hypothetical protein